MWSLWFLAVLILLCILFVYYKLYLPLQFWKVRNVVHTTPSLIVGNLGSVLTKKEVFNIWLQKECIKYEGHRYFGIYQFSKPSLVLLDTELIKDVFVKNFDNFTDHTDFLPKEVDTIWKKTLFSREGEDWHNMRTTLSPAFTSRKMKTMFYLVTEVSERFVNYFLKKNTTVSVDIMDASTKFTNDVIASCAFGVNCDSLKNEKNEFYLMGKEAFDFSGWKSMKFFGNALSPTLSRLFKIKMFSNKVRDFFIRVTKEVKSHREQTGLYRPDVFHLLMEAQKGKLTYDEDTSISSGFSGIDESYLMKRNVANNILISDEDIASQLLVFFFGSHDTVSSVISQTIYELVANMDVQEKLTKEIDDTLQQNNGKITYEALFTMKYLDMVITETMRLWAPPTVIQRNCTKPFIIKPSQPSENNLLIEPGTEVVIPVYAFHKNPKYFKNPDKFDPERFNDINKNNIKSFTYFPFGVGPRFCIGNRFALMVIKILICNLLTHFQIVPDEKTVIPFEQTKDNLLLRSDNGYWFGLKPRNK